MRHIPVSILSATGLEDGFGALSGRACPAQAEQPSCSAGHLRKDPSRFGDGDAGSVNDSYL